VKRRRGSTTESETVPPQSFLDLFSELVSGKRITHHARRYKRKNLLGEGEEMEEVTMKSSGGWAKRELKKMGEGNRDIGVSIIAKSGRHD